MTLSYLSVPPPSLARSLPSMTNFTLPCPIPTLGGVFSTEDGFSCLLFLFSVIIFYSTITFLSLSYKRDGSVSLSFPLMNLTLYQMPPWGSGTSWLFLWMNDIPLCIIVSLATHLFLHIWVVSRHWLLWISLQGTEGYRYFSFIVFFGPLGCIPSSAIADQMDTQCLDFWGMLILWLDQPTSQAAESESSFLPASAQHCLFLFSWIRTSFRPRLF